MRYKASELSYERVWVFGRTGFFTNERIQKDSVPEGVFQYEVRHDDLCQGIPCEGMYHKQILPSIPPPTPPIRAGMACVPNATLIVDSSTI